uniref:Uncharacterized protein n=1 Tax=Aureoumbra lagunensis TaxID=44058 RepID=A0A7S3JYP5_9STRA|mmetsp:Transcript_13933/g.18593  ORF Transcript_13933/g.18593 Transcript_13933/m.18593 type:complete len:127 (-) Transcript_13933:89-469(-)
MYDQHELDISSNKVLGEEIFKVSKKSNTETTLTLLTHTIRAAYAVVTNANMFSFGSFITGFLEPDEDLLTESSVTRYPVDNFEYGFFVDMEDDDDDVFQEIPQLRRKIIKRRFEPTINRPIFAPVH